MKVSVIVCAYNERHNLPITLKRLQRHPILPWQREIIVVDSASTDGTILWLKKYRGSKVKKIFHPQNLGKSASIRSAFRQATGDYILIQDADLEYHPRDHHDLLSLAGKYQAVYGSRILKDKVHYKYIHAYLGVKLLTWLTNFLFKSSLTDVATAMKLINRKLVKKLSSTSNGFGWDFEVTAKLLKRKLPIAEVPIGYNPRTYQQGKKITVLDGLKALLIILKTKFIS